MGSEGGECANSKIPPQRDEMYAPCIFLQFSKKPESRREVLGQVRTRESGMEAGPGLQERSRPLRTQSRAHRADPTGVGAEAHALGPTTASHRTLRPTSTGLPSVAPTKVPQTAGVYDLADPDVRSLQCISWTQTGVGRAGSVREHQGRTWPSQLLRRPQPLAHGHTPPTSACHHISFLRL